MKGRWMKSTLLAGLLLVTGSSIAAAAVAYTISAVNLRAGPSTRYEVLRTIPGGRRVTVYGCVRGYRWCHVRYRGWDGYVSERYLDFEDDDYYDVVPIIPPGRIELYFGLGRRWRDPGPVGPGPSLPPPGSVPPPF